MKLKSLPLLLSITVLLAGCGPTLLVPVTYDKEVIAQSNLDAYVELNTGRVTGHSSSSLIYAGGVYVPVSTGPIPELQFGSEDQMVFVDSLKSEMQRLGIIDSVSDVATDNTLRIVLNFVQTEHYPNFQEYKLTVGMIMAYHSKETVKTYEVLSSEGDSGWEKWNTSASEGKEKAAVKLMDLVISDIQEFILATQP